jgi:hypothetical protein
LHPFSLTSRGADRTAQVMAFDLKRNKLNFQ